MRFNSTRSEVSNAIRMTELKARFESIDEEETGVDSRLIELAEEGRDPEKEIQTDDQAR